jgi:hypothetical protein
VQVVLGLLEWLQQEVILLLMVITKSILLIQEMILKSLPQDTVRLNILLSLVEQVQEAVQPLVVALAVIVLLQNFLLTKLLIQ